jgi:hypothetical protein
MTLRPARGALVRHAAKPVGVFHVAADLESWDKRGLEPIPDFNGPADGERRLQGRSLSAMASSLLPARAINPLPLVVTGSSCPWARGPCSWERSPCVGSVTPWSHPQRGQASRRRSTPRTSLLRLRRCLSRAKRRDSDRRRSAPDRHRGCRLVVVRRAFWDTVASCTPSHRRRSGPLGSTVVRERELRCPAERSGQPGVGALR